MSTFQVYVSSTWLDLKVEPGRYGLSIMAVPGAGKSTLLRHIARNAWDQPELVGLSGRRLSLLVRLPAAA